jgi:hypothetical protein
MDFKLEKPAEGSATAKFIKMLDKLNADLKTVKGEPSIHFMPQKWYGARDFDSFFKALRGLFELMNVQDKKNVGKNKDYSMKEKPAEKERREKARIADLDAIRELIPGVAGDFKARRDNFLKGLSEAQRDELKGRDLDWVDSPGASVKKWQDAVYTLEEKEKHRANPRIENRELEKEPEKERGVGIADPTKWQDMQKDMKLLLKDISFLTGKLDVSEIPKPDEVPKSAYQLLTSGDSTVQRKDIGEESKYEGLSIEERSKAIHDKFMKKKKEFDEAFKQITDWVDANEEEAAKREVEKVRKETEGEVPEIKKGKAPVIFYSSAIDFSLDLFKKMSSLYQGVIWFRGRKEVKPLEEKREIKAEEPSAEPVTKGEKTPEAMDILYKRVLDLKKDAVHSLDHFVAIGIESKESREKAHIAQKKLRAFEDKASDYLFNIERAKKKKPVQAIHDLFYRLSVELGDKATVTEYEKAFPYDKTVQRLDQAIKNEKALKWAKQELNEIFNYFKKVYLNPSEKVRGISERLKKTPQEMVLNGLDKIMNIFVDYWKNFSEEMDSPKEDDLDVSQLPKKYENLFKIIKHLQKEGVFPEFSEAKEVSEKVTMPTKHEIMDYIERTWMNQSPEFIEGLKKHVHLNEKEVGKEAGSARKQEKVQKPIVQGIQEILQDHLILDYLEGKDSPEEFIQDIIHRIGTGLRTHSHMGKTVDIGTAMSSILSILKYIPYVMTQIRVGAPGVKMQMKKVVPASALTPKWLLDQSEGHIKWRDRKKGDDIIIDSLKEAEELKKRIDDLYKVIELYIHPDKVGFKYPYGFDEAYQQFQHEEKKGPHAPEAPREEKKAELYDYPSQLSFNVCAKALTLDIPEDEFSAFLK